MASITILLKFGDLTGFSFHQFPHIRRLADIPLNKDKLLS